MRSIVASATTAVVICLTAVGCGSSTPSAQDRIQASFKQAANALKSGDGKGFCDQLTPQDRQAIDAQVKKALSAGSCDTAISMLVKASRQAGGAKVTNSLDQLANGKLKNIKVSGSTAEAQIDPPQPGNRPIKFALVDGQWKISG
jgi:DNA-directed RNA polymerase beta' subunit